MLGVVVACACCAPVAPPLRRELARVFTLRTYCHPENKCPLTLVVRSSGLILAFLNPSQRHAPLAANTARNRQHGAPTRRGGAVDWLHPWWREEPLKLKKPLYDRVWWVETSTACTRPSASMWHGTLMEHSSSKLVRQRLPLCGLTRACVHMPYC